MAREREVKITVVGEDRGASRALKQVDDAAAKMGPSSKIAQSAMDGVQSKLNDFGPIGAKASDALGKVGAGATSTGALLGGALAGGALVGAAALAKFAFDGVQAMVELAGEVRNFQRATGLGAEDASRMISVLDDLGISSEQGASAMFKLAKNVADGGEKLKVYGIEVGRTKDGNVDMVTTLASVADAYASTTDPAKRAEIAFAAFGKAGQALIPILEKGSAGFTKMFDAVKRGEILSQKQIDDTREFELAVDDVQDSFRSLQIQAGSALLPYITSLAEAGTKTLDFIDKLGREDGKGGKGGLAFVLENIVEKLGPLGPALMIVSAAKQGAGEAAEGAAAKFDLEVTKLEQLGVQVTDVEKATGELTEETKRAAAEAQKYKDRIESMATAIASGYTTLSGKTAEVSEKHRDMARGMDTAKTSAAQLKQGMEALIGVHVSAQQAAIRWEEAIDQTTATLRENERTLDINSEAGRENQSAIIGMIQAGLQHAEALQAEGHSAEYVASTQRDHVAALTSVMEQAGYTTIEIFQLLDRYNLLAAAPDIYKRIVTDVIENRYVRNIGNLFAAGGIVGAARGMKVNRPTILVGEGNPNHEEYVIATDPQYRDRNMKLLAAAAKAMGVSGGPGAVGTDGSWYSGEGNSMVVGPGAIVVYALDPQAYALQTRDALVRYSKRVSGLFE